VDTTAFSGWLGKDIINELIYINNFELTNNSKIVNAERNSLITLKLYNVLSKFKCAVLLQPNLPLNIKLEEWNKNIKTLKESTDKIEKDEDATVNHFLAHMKLLKFPLHEVYQMPWLDTNHTKLITFVLKGLGRKRLYKCSNYVFLLNLFVMKSLIDKKIWSEWGKIELLIPFEKLGSPTSVAKYMKKLTVEIKRFGDALFKDYRIWVHLENMCGYLIGEGVTEPLPDDDVIEWGCGRKYYSLAGSDDEYERVFRNVCVKLLYENRRPFSGEHFSLRKFVMSGDWISKGASTRGEMLLMVDDDGVRKSKKAKKTKSTYALSEPASVIYDKVRMVDKDELAVAVKAETGMKTRHIITADEYPQILQGWISRELLESTQRRNGFTTLFYDNFNLCKMFLRQRMIMKSKGGNWLDLDAEKFDANVATNEIEALMDAYAKYSVIMGREDLLTTIERIKDITLNKTSLYKKDTHLSFQWLHGVPSGIRWTALNDSMISAARMEMASQVCNNILHSRLERDNDSVAQGDDIAVLTKTMTAAILAALFFEYVGIPMNPTKSLLTYNRNEYLRRVVTPDNIRGYLPRKLGSILFRNPLKTEQPNEYNNPYETVKEMFTVLRRGGDPVITISVLIVMISNKINAKRKDVYDWLRTPASMGGAGLFPWSNRWVKLVSGSKYYESKIIAKRKNLFSDKSLDLKNRYKLNFDYEKEKEQGVKYRGEKVVSETRTVLTEIPKLMLRVEALSFMSNIENMPDDFLPVNADDDPWRITVLEDNESDSLSNQEVAEKMIKFKNLPGLVKVLTEECATRINDLKKRTDNNDVLFWDILGGEFNWAIPTNMKVDDTVVSVVAKYYEIKAKNKLNGKRRITRIMIEQFILSYEINIFNFLDRKFNYFYSS
jgi:hypothetical protein